LRELCFQGFQPGSVSKKFSCGNGHFPQSRRQSAELLGPSKKISFPHGKPYSVQIEFTDGYSIVAPYNGFPKMGVYDEIPDLFSKR